MTASNIAIALDVGERRVGVARADLKIGIASALPTLHRSSTTLSDIRQIAHENNADVVVVGLPRGLDGQETDQTRSVNTFADELKTHIAIPVIFQDEALTSRQAEAELEKRGKPYKKSDIDALSAIYILEDYIAINRPKASA